MAVVEEVEVMMVAEAAAVAAEEGAAADGWADERYAVLCSLKIR